MPTELLEQLRDIHEPLAPGYWPLTLAWWITIAIAILILVTSVILWIRLHRKFAPYRYIRNQARTLTQHRLSKEIDGLTYATKINLLYKELFVEVENRHEVISMFGPAWLDMIAERFGQDGFRFGAGRCLGTARFISESFSDNGLDDLVKQTLFKVRPLKER